MALNISNFEKKKHDGSNLGKSGRTSSPVPLHAITENTGTLSTLEKHIFLTAKTCNLRAVWHIQFSFLTFFFLFFKQSDVHLVLQVIGRNVNCCHRTFHSEGIICKGLKGRTPPSQLYVFFLSLLMPRLNGNSLSCILRGCAEHAVVTKDKKEWGHNALPSSLPFLPWQARGKRRGHKVHLCFVLFFCWGKNK